jgi:competence ComEA-like helix-hairpin-helix protein
VSGARTGGLLLWPSLLALALGLAWLRCGDGERLGPACATLPQAPRWTIDLNEAEPGEMQVLPGVGPSLAHRIERERRVHGPFKGPGDLDRVPGIGPALLERIRPHVR